jgi:hypothetical protein
MKLVQKTVTLVLAAIFFQGVCFAGSDLYVLPDCKDYFIDDTTQFQFNSTTANVQNSSSTQSNMQLNVGFLHKIFGYSTLALAGIAGLTGSDSSMHHNSAMGATALGLMTLATGYYEYGDMFEIDEGFSNYNLHIVLGTIGALGFAAEAIIASTDSGHGGLGIGSAIAMGGATVIIYW